MADSRLKHLAAAWPQLVELDVPMSEHTTFRIGGPADALAVPTTIPELKELLQFCAKQQLPIMVIGRGSNLLVRDGGLRAVVIKIADAMSTVALKEDGLQAEAGISLAALSRTAASAGFGGLEFASGIPGTLGGALMMNAGAYGGTMQDVVQQVTALDSVGNEHVLSAEELDFGYRHSALLQRQLIAVSARLRLPEQDPMISKQIMADLANRRREKQPIHLPSAGSVFKRPPGHYAGALIQQAGLMGKRIGGAEVSTLHAGFIVNIGGATAADVESLIQHVQQTVYDKFGVWLETEVRIVGEKVG
ncbi:MAG: UDP-N-acetylmuramate dehydrogenase [Bacillota bacterium]